MTRMIVNKLKSPKGESLTEVLAAILVGGLAILLLAMAITTASNINRQSRDAMDGYYATNNELVDVSGSHVTIVKPNSTEPNITLTDITEDHSSWSDSYFVQYAIDEEAGGSPVVRYEEISEP